MRKVICAHLLNDYSGSPKVLSQIIATLNKNNIAVDLYTNGSLGFLSHCKANHHTVFYKWSRFKLVTLLLLMASQVHLAFNLLKYRNKDVIIYVNTLLPFGAAIMGKLLKKPVIYHIHETSIKPLVFKRFLRAIVKRTASKIIFVSKALQSSESFNTIPQTVIYNALPREFALQAFKHNYALNNTKEFKVYMVCSLKPYKGINEFVEIAQACEHQPAISFKLVLNANKKEISDYFERFSLPKNLKLIDMQVNLDKHYKQANLVLNLSRPDQWVETFGLTILEAMAYGVPIIVPPVGGPTELIDHGKQGYLISGYNIPEIAETILNLYSNNNLCLELSQNARDKAKTFNEDTFNLQIMKVIHD